MHTLLRSVHCVNSLNIVYIHKTQRRRRGPKTLPVHAGTQMLPFQRYTLSIGGLVAEYIVAIDVTRVRFPADALFLV